MGEKPAFWAANKNWSGVSFCFEAVPGGGSRSSKAAGSEGKSPSLRKTPFWLLMAFTLAKVEWGGKLAGLAGHTHRELPNGWAVTTRRGNRNTREVQNRTKSFVLRFNFLWLSSRFFEFI